MSNEGTAYFIQADITQKGKVVKTNGIPALIDLEQGNVFSEKLKEFAETRLTRQAKKLEQVIDPGLEIDLSFCVKNDIANTWSQFASFYTSDQRLVFH